MSLQQLAACAAPADASGLRQVMQLAETMGPAELEAWLMAPSGQACRCGSSMSHAEKLSGACDRCIEAFDRRERPPVDPFAARRTALIPEKYLECDLARWEGPLPKAAEIEVWREHWREPLLLLGRNGTGKTHLATALLIEQLENERRRCVWIDGCWAEAALSDELNTDGRPLWRLLLECDVLLVDDLDQLQGLNGSGARKAWGGRQVELVLSERINRRRSLIATLNQTEAEFYAANSRLATRLTSGIRIQTTGRDRRHL